MLSLSSISTVMLILFYVMLYKNTKRITELIKKDSITNHIQHDQSWKKEFLINQKNKRKKLNKWLIFSAGITLSLFATSLILIITDHVFEEVYEISGFHIFLIIVFILSFLATLILVILIILGCFKPVQYEVNGYLIIRASRLGSKYYYDVDKYIIPMGNIDLLSFLDCEELMYMEGAIFPSRLIEKKEEENTSLS